MIGSLLYLSSASTGLSDHEIQVLLGQSKKRNTLAGISGFLIYKDKTFIHYLEGEKEAMKLVFSRISEDSRHRGIIVLLEREIPEIKFRAHHNTFETCNDEDRFLEFKSCIDDLQCLAGADRTIYFKIVKGILDSMGPCVKFNSQFPLDRSVD